MHGSQNSFKLNPQIQQVIHELMERLFMSNNNNNTLANLNKDIEGHSHNSMRIPEIYHHLHNLL